MSDLITNGQVVNGEFDYLPDPMTAYKLRRMIDCEIKAIKRMAGVQDFYHPIISRMEEMDNPVDRRYAFGEFLDVSFEELSLRIECFRRVDIALKDPAKMFIEGGEETVGESGQTYPFRLIMNAEEVEPETVDWLWEPRVAFGFLTLFAGRTGSGKSLVAIDLAARLSRGMEMPLGGQACEPARTLFFSEDNVARMIVPRLIAAGADRRFIKVATPEAQAKFSLGDQKMLEDFYAASGRPRLVVIDPPANFLKGKDENSNEQVRSLLMAMSAWVEKENVAVILITHCNKGYQKGARALDRVIASVAWTTATRIVHILGEHPQDEGSKVFAMDKTNLGPLDRSATYKIVASAESSRITWTGYSDLKANEIESKSGGEGGRGNRGPAPRAEKALGWLKEKFREKMAWKSTELYEEAEMSGHSRNALWDVKMAKMLDIRAKQERDDEGPSYWVWYVSPGWDQEHSVRTDLDDPPLAAFN